MGDLLTSKALRGLGLPDKRLSFDGLNPVDGSATGSDYDEAGPGPGTAIPDDSLSRLIVEVSHAQGEDLEFYVARPGDPGPSSPAEVLFRESDDAAEPLLAGWRAWNRPTFAHHEHGLVWAPVVGLGPQSHDAAVVPSSQVLVVVYVRSGGMFSKTLDGSGWSIERQIVPTGNGIGDCCVCVLPVGERILAITTTGTRSVYFSDDNGQTWALYSAGALPVVGDPVRRSRAVVAGGLVMVLRENSAGPNTWRQYVSRDLGATFSLVATVTVGQFPELLAFPDGSVGVVYRNNATGQATFRRTSSPFVGFDQAVAVLLAPGVVTMTDACVEPDGIIWVIRQIAPGFHSVLRSADLGVTWELQPTDVISLGVTRPRAPQGKLVSIDGSFAWIWQAFNNATATNEEHLIVLWLGGWQNIGCGPDFGWGTGTGTFAAPLGAVYLPIDVPGLPWVPGGAGTSVVVSPSILEIVTVGVQTRAFPTGLAGAPVPTRLQAIFQVQHVSGGVLAQSDCGFSFRVADGVVDYRANVNLAEVAGGFANETRFRLVDGNSLATLAEITPVPDNLGIYMEFLVDMDGTTGDLKLHWRLTGPAAPASQWIEVYSGALALAGVPSATGEVRWGHSDPGTATTRWSMVAYKAWQPLQTQGNDFLVHELANKRGRAVGGLGYPLGFIEGLLPALRELEDRVVLGSLRGGPARLAETFTVPASYQFGVENLFAELSPSPSSTWRSKTRRPTSFAWSFPRVTRLGDSWILGVLLERPNFRRAWVDVDTSATGTGTWVQIGEINPAAGFEGLDYVRNGDQARPDLAAPTSTAGRYLHRAELAGGLFVDAGGNAVRIEGNTSGRWTQFNTVAPFIRLASVTGIPASGVCDLVAPRALWFFHFDQALASFVSGLRIRLDDSIAVDGEDYMELGMLRPVALVPWGQQPSRGWSQDLEPNTSENTFRSGTIRKRREGPPARRWTWSWPDGVRMQGIRNGEAPDFLGVAGKPPAIVREDVWTLLWGLLEESRGGEIPVVPCNFIPKNGGNPGTITDRTLYMLATLDGSGRFDHVLGDEGDSEFGRVSPISFRELV